MPSFPRLYLLVAGLIVWGALFFQVALSVGIMLAHGRSFFDALDRVFIFFTILTNLGLALYYTAHFVPVRPSPGWFRPIQPVVEGALAVALIFVLAIFNLILQWGLKHTGAALWADRLLHDVTPAMYLYYWARFAPKGRLRRLDILWFLLYPALYFAYVLVRGYFSHLYPYPFIDAGQLGYGLVLGTGALVLALFALVGRLLVAIDRRCAQQETG